MWHLFVVLYTQMQLLLMTAFLLLHLKRNVMSSLQNKAEITLYTGT